jgi:hypothetical protein
MSEPLTRGIGSGDVRARKGQTALMHTKRSLICFALCCALACGPAQNGPSRGGNPEASCPSLHELRSSGDPETFGELGRSKRYDGPSVLGHSGAYELRAIVGFGDCFVTGADGRAAIELFGGGRVQLQPNTHACVLDAQPNSVFVVSGSLSGALDDNEAREAVKLVTSPGALTLAGGAAARVALPRVGRRRRSQAKLEMVRGQALLERRTTLTSDAPSFAIVGIPCSLELEPVAWDEAENALDGLLVRYEAELEGLRKGEKHAGSLPMFNLFAMTAAAAEVSALEVLSGCAARGERETDCSALATWRHEQLPRLGSVWLHDHLGRGVQTF